jgi:hypothetical protein
MKRLEGVMLWRYTRHVLAEHAWLAWSRIGLLACRLELAASKVPQLRDKVEFY